jgi:release factor glutamine methyltransferase
MPEAVKTWLVLDLIRLTESLFRDNGIDNPRLNAELLLADTLNLRRFDLYLNFDRPLGESELADYRSSVKRRIAREPLQYITGKAEFYGLPFEVNPAVLTKTGNRAACGKDSCIIEGKEHHESAHT